MVAELKHDNDINKDGCSLAKISMVAELGGDSGFTTYSCSLAKISMVAEPQNV